MTWKNIPRGWKPIAPYWGYCESDYAQKTHYADYIETRVALPFAKKICKRHLKFHKIAASMIKK